jgi:hypothetical protein
MSGAYVYSGAFIPGTLARAEQVGVEYTSVATGFSVLAIQGTDSGVANAYIVTTAGGKNGVYTDGMIVEFKALNANTSSSTITVDGGSVVGLTNSTGQSLASGALSANTWYRALYNSTYSAWTVVAPTSLVTTSNTISAAAPTNKVGLTAAGGVSTACAPIDATYALDQSIAPTWTGAHTFSNTVTFNSSVSFATGLSLAGAAGSYALTLTGSSTTGQSKGLLVKAGTNSSDISALFQNQSGASTFFQIDGAGSLTVGSPTGGGKGAGTINATGVYIGGVAVSTTTITSANPSASVGLSAVNGTSTSYMTADSAPVLSQAIAPTWTGAHVFTPAAGVAATVNVKANQIGISVVGGTNTANNYLASFVSAQAAGFSSGVLIEAATTVGDYALVVNDATNGTNFFAVRGDSLVTVGNATVSSYIVAPNLGVTKAGIVNLGIRNTTNSVEGLFRADTATVIFGAMTNHALLLRSNNANIMQLNSTSISGLGPVAAGLVDMTPDQGTFTGTLTGMTGSVTGTCIWTRVGNLVTLFIPTMTGTSNSTAMTLTGLPSAIQPARAQLLQNALYSVEDSGASNGLVTVRVNAGSTMTFFLSGNANGFQNVGAKGVVVAFTVSYLLN